MYESKSQISRGNKMAACSKVFRTVEHVKSSGVLDRQCCKQYCNSKLDLQLACCCPLTTPPSMQRPGKAQMESDEVSQPPKTLGDISQSEWEAGHDDV